jgi:hypothetical protein
MSAELREYTVQGFGYEVDVVASSPDRARKRAMWALIANGYIEIEGTPDEMLARFGAFEGKPVGVA